MGERREVGRVILGESDVRVKGGEGERSGMDIKVAMGGEVGD